MSDGYFHRVNNLSPTRFWINNPTPQEARIAIAAGAVSCTTNPTYAMKQIKAESEGEVALHIIDELIKEVADDGKAADLVQQKLAKRILDIFLPLHEKNRGKEGFVSLQGDPFKDDDPDHIVSEAMGYGKLARNFIAKIPATRAGLKAIEALIPEDIPIIATEVMGISQAVYTCEMYKKVSKQCGKYPPFYLTHITGIFDEHLKNVVKRDGIDISPDVLWQAGCIVARKQYKIFKERGYSGVMLGGGARGLHHFTELVGSEMHITINWRGTADKLIESDPPVVYRIDNPAPQYVIDQLLEKIPDFRRAYLEDGLAVDEFKDFGPVVLFRNSFLKGWSFLLERIRERRETA
jgi:transaldolase